MGGGAVIARSAATKQSSGRRAPYVLLDCFAALAMTGLIRLQIILLWGRARPPAQTNFTSVPVPLSGARVKLDFE